MKFKYALAALSTIFVMAFSSTVFSAEVTKNTFEVGLPIDLSTGETVTTITEGQLLAFPVDIQITSEQAVFDSYCYSGIYDPEVIYPGLTAEEIQSSTAGLAIIGQCVPVSYNNVYYTLDKLVNPGLFGGATSKGSPDAQIRTDCDNTVSANWHCTDKVTDEANPELYILFKGKKTVDLDAVSLNYELLKDCVEHSSIDVENDPATETPKLNACAGAFQVTIDGSKLPVWVTEVGVKDKNGTYTALTNGTSVGAATEKAVYTFPVRVQLTEGGTQTAADTAEYTICAKVSNTADGEGTLKDITNINVPLAGTVKSYTDNDVSSSIK